MELFDLFNTWRFVPRAQCGQWTQGLIYLHNISDFFIWAAYVAIPVVLVSFAYRRRDELPFRQLFWLFGLFIVACGTTHLMEIILFYKPVYVLAGWVKLITAAASWGTVLALFHVVPRALQMKSPDVLEHEVALRVAELNELNLQLAEANAVKDNLLQREQELRREAENANRVKDEFLATVSHELRTPLTSILGWSSLLAGDLNEEDKMHDGLLAIERNARAQTQIVDDLLDVSRIVTGQMKLDAEPVRIAELVEASIDAVRPLAQVKNIDLVLKPDQENAATKVNGDRTRLQQIMWNLLSNAVKFTPKEGRVEISWLCEASQVVIEIKDNGSGIKPEFLPYAFERFRQEDSSTTRTFGGLGLGLAIVRHLVEMHGGTIEAYSAGLNQGATFTVRLPVLVINTSLHQQEPQTQEYQGQMHNRVESTPLNRLQGLRVLLIEDDTDARQMISTVLRHYASAVQSAARAEDGFHLLQETRPDALVCDIGLPDEDGYKLMERIRRLPEKEGGLTPAIALTAYASPRDRMQALAAGFQAHLSKPVQPEHLVECVADLAGRN